MKKKMIIAAVFVFALALTASVAFATYQSNTSVGSYNGVSSVATTGGVSINKAGVCGSVYVTSGNANSSAAGVAAMNTNVAVHSGKTAQTNNSYQDMNEVGSGAGTGGVDINKAHVGGVVSVTSGNAGSSVRGVSVMNTNVSVGCACRPHRPCHCQ